jgi:ComF family protein
MGELLCETLVARPVNVDLVVPVPLSQSRLRARGYNQAALLAEQVVPSVGGMLASSVLTRSDRPPQQTLRANERMSNLAGIITCNAPDAVKRKRILLVDDVVTTGATVSACADTLAAAGAARISALAFARDL